MLTIKTGDIGVTNVPLIQVDKGYDRLRKWRPTETGKHSITSGPHKSKHITTYGRNGEKVFDAGKIVIFIRNVSGVLVVCIMCGSEWYIPPEYIDWK